MVTKKEMNGEWEVCAGVHCVSQSQRRHSSMNGEDGHWYCWKSWHRVHPGSFKLSQGEIICQRRMRVVMLVTKTLQDIRYQKAFASVQTLWSDKSRYGWQLYLEINLSFQALFICFAWLWPWNLQGKKKKEGCQTDYIGNIFYLKTAQHQPSTSESIR